MGMWFARVVCAWCAEVATTSGSQRAVGVQLAGVSVQRHVQEKTAEVGVLRGGWERRARREKHDPEVQAMQMIPVRVAISEIASAIAVHVPNPVEGGPGGEKARGRTRTMISRTLRRRRRRRRRRGRGRAPGAVLGRVLV